MNIYPVTLEGRLVRLEPLSEAHVPGLAALGLDERIWRYMRYKPVRTAAQMRLWVIELLELQKRGSDLPFAVIYRESGQPVGATRYLNVDHNDRSVEIGGTWYGVSYQRTAVNTECKFLLLRHAFEVLDCIRVQFKTDLRNLASQRALERIGAVREGVLRSHMILPDGFIRDSVIYSILPGEWPQVRLRLEEKLEGIQDGR